MGETEIRYVEKKVNKKGIGYYISHPGEFLSYLKAAYQFRIYFPYLGYWYHKYFLKNRVFTLASKNYSYFTHRFNQTFYNERCVEIPVVKEYFTECSAADILEVGNVLSHYFDFGHTIIDKFEKAPGVINVDAIDYNPGRQFKRIVSISTLEHVGWDDYPRDDKKIPVAVNVLKALLEPGGKLLVTAPMGYNPNLDLLIKNDTLGFQKQLFLKKVSSSGVWKEVQLNDTEGAKYGKPFPCANILFLGIYEKNV